MGNRAVIQELADALKARGVGRVVYFHCDHFEPWGTFGGLRVLDERHVEHLRGFADDSARIDYARKLTLFYRCYLGATFDRARPLIRAADDDFVGFVPRSELAVRLGRAGMKYLVDTVAHSIQIHIHHEGFTNNTSHTRPEVIDYFRSERARALDSDRIALVVKLMKQAIREETDIALDRWFFVHGHWALNGADADSCTIADEIAVLMGTGCKGDFTFPAGRAHVNPRLELPYFCRPITAPRAYDRDEASPEPAYGNAAAARAKFFVWASEIKHNRSSIDYYSPAVRKNLEAPEEWARDVVATSYVAGGTLFFKTHAHSMFPYYREDKRRPIYPHAHPGVQTLFSMVFDAAAAAGAEIEFLTAPEVYDRFVQADATAADAPTAPGGVRQQGPDGDALSPAPRSAA